MNSQENILISIIGPTAIGKTALSIKLAQHFNTEIISADSRQFFKEMQIGTAAPNKIELEASKHHFIHHKSIKDDYSVGSFERDAIKCLSSLFLKHNVVVMVGGSGLYVDAITKGLDYFPDIDPSVRSKLNEDLELFGLEHLQKQLKAIDPKSYKTIALDNPHRIIRALEVSIGSGRPYSSFLKKNKEQRPFKIISIGLTADRDIIYQRINKRVELMVEDGLIQEVESLIDFRDFNALNTVGYKEIFKYLNDTWDLEFAISEIKKNTRRFAKRQLTWFNKNKNTRWFNYSEDAELIIKHIESQIE